MSDKICIWLKFHLGTLCFIYRYRIQKLKHSKVFHIWNCKQTSRYLCPIRTILPVFFPVSSWSSINYSTKLKDTGEIILYIWSCEWCILLLCQQSQNYLFVISIDWAIVHWESQVELFHTREHGGWDWGKGRLLFSHASSEEPTRTSILFQLLIFSHTIF